MSKYVLPGDKVDIRTVKKRRNQEEEPEVRIYQTHVYDILSGDRIEVVMPMEQTKLIVLPIGSEHDMIFCAKTGMYQCRVKVVDRDKKGGNYLLVMDLISNLCKEQRREYFRFSCALEMNSRALEKEEMALAGKKEELLIPQLPLKSSVIVDISGGGLRFVANYAYEVQSLILCKYHLMINGENKEYNLVGKVLSVRELENRKGVFEHRVQYVNVDATEREEIIKYIFDEERKTLKNQKGE